MKKHLILSIASLLMITSLAGCGGGSDPSETPTIPEINEKVKTAIDSLRNHSHYVHVEQDVAIYKPSQPEVCDIYNLYIYDIGHFYSETERSYSIKMEREFCDLDKETGEKLENTIRHSDVPEMLYFKDMEDGTAYIEEVTYQNELKSTTVAFYDEDSGIYQPVIFDSEFKNPWDYISYRDVAIKEDGNLTLINEKDDFLAECYETVGLNFVSDNTILLDDQGRITGVEFQIDDLVEENYTRTNSLSVVYSGLDTAVLKHRAPSTNNNPELQAAFDSIKNVKNYTYSKEFTYSYGATKDYITGYFTEEEIYFRHHTEAGIEHPYTTGDDYDYKVKINNDGVTYTGYEYNLKGDTWKWGVIMVSGTSPYILENFEESGPKFYEIDASIFKKIDERTYQIEDYFLLDSGSFFDYGMLGVQSAAFEGNTSKMIITLGEDGSLEKVETGFKFMGVDYYINYYLSNIGTTEIPEWSNQEVKIEY